MGGFFGFLESTLWDLFFVFALALFPDLGFFSFSLTLLSMTALLIFSVDLTLSTILSVDVTLNAIFLDIYKKMFISKLKKSYTWKNKNWKFQASCWVH